ncbi:hypothetical protein U1Q18_048306, partial [Sarracenia purpurea var. burkii]
LSQHQETPPRPLRAPIWVLVPTSGRTTGTPSASRFLVPTVRATPCAAWSTTSTRRATNAEGTLKSEESFKPRRIGVLYDEEDGRDLAGVVVSESTLRAETFKIDLQKLVPRTALMPRLVTPAEQRALRSATRAALRPRSMTPHQATIPAEDRQRQSATPRLGNDV